MSNHNEVHSQTEQFIGQIDEFLLSKSTSGDIQNEMQNFLSLLGKIPQEQEQPQSQNVVRNQSLSVIYSISSEYSSHSDEQKQNMVYHMVQEMNSKIQEITRELEESTVREKVKSIHTTYLHQMDEVNKHYLEFVKQLLTASQNIEIIKQHYVELQQEKTQLERQLDNVKNQYVLLNPAFQLFLKGSVNEDLYKMKSIESDLKRSLEQAQLFNANLSKLLKIKVEEQRYKDSQCKQIHTSLTDLNHELNNFQNQFYGINSNLKNLFQRVQDIWAYNNQNNKANKLIEEILQDQAKFSLHDKSITDSIQTEYTTYKNSKLSEEKTKKSQKEIGKTFKTTANSKTPEKKTSKTRSNSNENKFKNQYTTTTKKTSPKLSTRQQIEQRYRQLFKDYRNNY